MKWIKTMKKLYHYTKSETLKKITLKDDIVIKSTRYDRHGNGEYVWIKEKTDVAIKEICEEKGEAYDENPLKFIPYTISFCRNGYLKSMWKDYADNYQGIQLVFNFEKIRELSLPDNNPMVFMPCHYMNSEDDLKSILIDIREKYYLPESYNLQSDLTECSACLKQMKFKNEDEFRLLYPNHDMMSASYNGGDVLFKEYEDIRGLSECGNELTYMQHFPKDILEGIVVGHLMSDAEMEELKQHLLSNGYESIANTMRRINAKEYV